MSREPLTTAPTDDLEEAQARMASAQVRRLPVVDGGRLVGVVSLNDIARAADGRRQAPNAQEVGRTLAAICRHRAEALARPVDAPPVPAPVAQPTRARANRHA